MHYGFVFWVFNHTIIVFLENHICCKFHVNGKRIHVSWIFQLSKILCRQNGNLCFPLVDQCSNMFAGYFMGLTKNLSCFKRSNMFVKYLKGWNISLHSQKILSCKKSINCLQWPNLKETPMIRHVVSFTNVNFQFPLVIRVFFLFVVWMSINAIAYQTFNNIKHLQMV